MKQHAAWYLFMRYRHIKMRNLHNKKVNETSVWEIEMKKQGIQQCGAHCEWVREWENCSIWISIKMCKLIYSRTPLCCFFITADNNDIEFSFTMFRAHDGNECINGNFYRVCVCEREHNNIVIIIMIKYHREEENLPSDAWWILNSLSFSFL
jgi:hypothetical protein